MFCFVYPLIIAISYTCFHRSKLEYYEGDPELPIFSRVTNGYSAEHVIHILMVATPSNKISVVQPVAVSENATFLIDLEKVDFCDLKSDDMGAWVTTGTKATHFYFNGSADTLVFTSRKGVRAKYVLKRRYYIHGTYQKYHRMIAVVEGIFYEKYLHAWLVL